MLLFPTGREGYEVLIEYDKLAITLTDLSSLLRYCNSLKSCVTSAKDYESIKSREGGMSQYQVKVPSLIPRQ